MSWSRPQEEEAEAEPPQEERKLTAGDIPAIAESLAKMGKSVEARYIRTVDGIREENGSYSLLIKQPLAYNSLKNAEKDIAKAIAAATGESYRIKLRLEGGTAQDDDDFSPEMRKLKAFFGGQLIHNDRIIAAKEADDDDFTIRNDEETQFS